MSLNENTLARHEDALARYKAYLAKPKSLGEDRLVTHKVSTSDKIALPIFDNSLKAVVFGGLAVVTVWLAPFQPLEAVRTLDRWINTATEYTTRVVPSFVPPTDQLGKSPLYKRPVGNRKSGAVAFEVPPFQ